MSVYFAAIRLGRGDVFNSDGDNRMQHPHGNVKGAGLKPQQRTAFDVWRVKYWKARALEELKKRGIKP